MSSPILQTFNAAEDIRAIRVTMAPPQEVPSSPFDIARRYDGTIPATAGPRLAIKFVKVDELEQTDVPTVAAAEEVIFQAATVRKVENTLQTSSGLNTILFEVNRSSSFIAMRTRRGAGNVVILGSKVAELLSGHIKACDPVEEGRWTLIGNYNGMQAYVGEDMPANEAIVAYTNYKNPVIDGPAGIVRTADGWSVAMLGSTESTLGNVSDYVQRLVVTNI